jgi:hypothetical protein
MLKKKKKNKKRRKKMAEFKFEITKKIGVLSTDPKGWTKELNMVSFNERPAKYDIRTWDKDHAKMGKGVTFTKEELETLKTLISQEV